MTKISEELEKYKDTEKTIKHYEKLIAEYERKSDKLEQDLEKREQLKCIKKALGDVDIKAKYLKILLDQDHDLKPIEVKRLYSIIADTNISPDQCFRYSRVQRCFQMNFLDRRWSYRHFLHLAGP